MWVEMMQNLGGWHRDNRYVQMSTTDLFYYRIIFLACRMTFSGDLGGVETNFSFLP